MKFLFKNSIGRMALKSLASVYYRKDTDPQYVCCVLERFRNEKDKMQGKSKWIKEAKMKIIQQKNEQKKIRKVMVRNKSEVERRKKKTVK